MSSTGPLSRIARAVQWRLRNPKVTWPRDRERLSKWRRVEVAEVLYLYSLPTVAGVGFHNPQGYALVDATMDNLAAMHEAQPRQFPERKLKILQGRVGSDVEHCYLIVTGEGDLAGYCHMTTADNVNELIGHRVEVGPADVYLYDARVFQDYRRQGLHAFSIARRLQMAADMGRSRALTVISTVSVASINSYGHFSARLDRRLVYMPRLHRTLDLPAVIRDDRER